MLKLLFCEQKQGENRMLQSSFSCITRKRLWVDVVIVSVFQFQFVWNVSHWNAMKPAFYHGHLAFVDFAQ